jgi:hypothetical protein
MGSELAVHKQTAENLGRRGRWGSQWLTPGPSSIPIQRLPNGVGGWAKENS